MDKATPANLLASGPIEVRLFSRTLGWAAVLIVAFLGLRVAYENLDIALATHTAVWQWDEWEELTELIKFKAGELSLWRFFWEMHNEHRVAMSRALMLLDTEFFGGMQILPRVATVVVWLGVFAVFAAPFLKRKSMLPTPARLFGLGAMLIVFFTSQHHENFFRGFNAQVMLVVALPIFSLLLIRIAEEARLTERLLLSRSAFFGALLAGVAGVYSMANGLVAWPVIVAYAFFLKTPRTRMAVIGIVMILSFASYLYGFKGSHAPPTELGPVKWLFSVAMYFFALIGGPFASWHGILASISVGVVVSGILAFFSLRLLVVRPDRFDSSWLLLSTCAIAVLTCAIVSYGRIGFGIGQALSPRYMAYLAPLYGSLLIIGLERLSVSSDQDSGVRAAIFAAESIAMAALSGLIVVLAFNQEAMRDWTRAEHYRYESAGAALLAGVPDIESLGRVHPGKVAVDLPLHDYLRTKRLSVFGDKDAYWWSQMVRTQLDRNLDVARLPLATDGEWCEGAATSVSPTGAPTPGDAGVWTRLEGWVADRETGRQADLVVVTDQHDRLAGIGRIVDLATAPAAVEVNHFVAYGAFGPVDEPRVYAYSSKHVALCLFNSRNILQRRLTRLNALALGAAPEMKAPFFQFEHEPASDQEVLMAHAPSTLRLPVTEAQTRIATRFGLFPTSYDAPAPERGNGVDMVIWGEDANGEREELWRRTLDPSRVEADCGEQSATVDFEPGRFAALVLEADPRGPSDYDKSYWSDVVVE